jgi:hypothetical protein
VKTYRGVRLEDGAQVTVDGRPLRPRFDLRRHSPTGFEWGYGGSGPAQLALAILADFLEDDDLALTVYQDFKRAVIAGIDGDEWTLTGDQIAAWWKGGYDEGGRPVEAEPVPGGER